MVSTLDPRYKERKKSSKRNKEAIYVDISDVKQEKKNGITKTTIKEGSEVYSSSKNYSRGRSSGRVRSSGTIKLSPAQIAADKAKAEKLEREATEAKARLDQERKAAQIAAEAKRQSQAQSKLRSNIPTGTRTDIGRDIVPPKIEKKPTGTIELAKDNKPSKDIRERVGDVKTKGGFGKETKIERQFREDIELGIPKEVAGKSTKLQFKVLVSEKELALQKKIDTGKITVEQANKRFEKYQETLIEKLEKKKPVKELFTPVREIEVRRKKEALKTLATFNPLGATILGVEASMRNEKIILEDPKKSLTAGEYTQTSPEAALYFGAAAVGAITKPFKIAKKIDIGRQEALQAKKLKTISTVSKQGDETVLSISGKRSTNYASQTVEGKIIGGELPKGKIGQRFYGEGTMKQTTRVESFLKTIQAKGKPVQEVTEEVVKVFGKGEVGKTILQTKGGIGAVPSKTKTVLGDTTIVKQPIEVKLKGEVPGKAIRFPSGKIVDTGKPIKLKVKVSPKEVSTSQYTGISYATDDFTIVSTGKISKLRFYEGGRITGKAPQTQIGIVKNIKQTEELADEGFKVISGTGAKSSPEYLQSLYKTQEIKIGLQSTAQEAAEKVIKITPIKPRKLDSVPVISPSLYSGKGQYEVTEMTVASPEFTNQPLLTQQKINYDFKPKIIEDTAIAIKSTSRGRSSINNKLKMENANLLKTKEIFQEAVVEQQVIQKPLQKQKTKQITKQKSALKLLQAMQSNFVPIKPQPIIPLVILPPKPRTPGKKPVTAKGKLKDMYTVYAREKGVDVKIGTAKTSKEAFKTLSKKLKKDISASGFVTTKGQKVKAKSFGTEFRRSKLDPFRVVQKKEKRLGTKTEVGQIQFFKKSKPTKRKKGFL